MARVSLLGFCVLTLLFFGCIRATNVGRMLPGKMYSMQDGTELEFRIETSRGSGGLEAVNRETGEHFTGHYAASYVGGGSAVGLLGDVPMVMVAVPTGANAQGILRGDRGTVIGIYLTIKPGDTPTGHGTGKDNRGQHYQVYF